jgi:alpha-L-fucosidase
LYNESSVKNEIVVNDRFHVGMPGNHGDYYSSEYQDMDISKTAHPWEENRGIGGSYGFNRAENFEDYSSSKNLILELVDIVSRGGNLLLNVGPAADGTIPVIMQERLIEIGNWLKVNGEGIYDSSKINTLVENHSQQKLYFTQNNQTVYCFFTKWNEKLVLKNLPFQEINAITLVGTNNLLSWEKDSNTITIELPRLTIDELPCMHCWCLKIE